MLRVLSSSPETAAKTPDSDGNPPEPGNVNNNSENSYFHSVVDSRNRSSEKCNSGGFQKSIEFKDLVYAVFQGRGLRNFAFVVLFLRA